MAFSETGTSVAFRPALRLVEYEPAFGPPLVRCHRPRCAARRAHWVIPCSGSESAAAFTARPLRRRIRLFDHPHQQLCRVPSFTLRFASIRNRRRWRLAAESTPPGSSPRSPAIAHPQSHPPSWGRAMRKPLFSRNRKPRPPDKRAAAAAFRPIHRPRLSSAVSSKVSYGRRGLRASCHEDRLSALPDDLLLLILQRLDTRSVLATATLSKRWACLPRSLDALDFRVSDILPARYYRCIRMRAEADDFTYGFAVDIKMLRANIERYERRAMRAMTSSINNFLDADADQERGRLGLRSGFHALTTLVLQNLPESTPNAAYEAIFTLCPQRQTLHLKSCMLNEGVVSIHAPKSEIKQLIMEHCPFGVIKLYALPMLESMAVVETIVSYKLSAFPYLTHLNINFHRASPLPPSSSGRGHPIPYLPSLCFLFIQIYGDGQQRLAPPSSSSLPPCRLRVYHRVPIPCPS
ncbi:hypothetical protein HU200_032064 [Digitaria exilis]|uniref:F-box domain-containing protein n=1 Tax=Digitaria exilis TaxID=1010633 RepID=A0A835EP13_9POAL|nr:hypothetical protein HU200_032064 [Digitaria exilis]